MMGVTSEKSTVGPKCSLNIRLPIDLKDPQRMATIIDFTNKLTEFVCFNRFRYKKKGDGEYHF